MNEDQRTRHDSFATSAVGVALLLSCIPMLWWDNHFPLWLTEIINPALLIGVAYLLARWKRSRLAWGMFWALAVICAVLFIVFIASGFHVTSGAELGGLALVGIVVFLVKMPRLHPAPPAGVSHVVHHHVLHGLDGQPADPGQYGTVLPGTVPVELDQAGRPAVGQRVPRAIESAAVLPAELAARIKQHINRRN